MVLWALVKHALSTHRPENMKAYLLAWGLFWKELRGKQWRLQAAGMPPGYDQT